MLPVSFNMFSLREDEQALRPNSVLLTENRHPVRVKPKGFSLQIKLLSREVKSFEPEQLLQLRTA